MTAEPSFVMAGRAGVVVADGVHTAYPSLDEARAALASGDVPIVLGALPFDTTRPTALMRPRSVSFLDALPDWPRRDLPAVRVAEMVPSPDVHHARVAEAIARLNDPSSGLLKVVLARALRLVADGPLDVLTILNRLAEDDTANAYFADLTPAGGDHDGTALVGASPELLVARTGDVVTCQPFAGSAPRSADLAADRANGAALAESAKNLHEHQLVVDEMRKVLDPLCVDLSIAYPTRAQQHVDGVAPQHAHHRTIARIINDRTGSRRRIASDTGGGRRAHRGGGSADQRVGGRPRLLCRRGRVV